jgi:tetratricopeptide (TPR) repeat protein
VARPSWSKIQVDEQLAEAPASLAFAKLIFDWDRQAAAAGFKRAIELNPNYPTAHQWYAFNLAALGRLDEALAEIRRAQELDPLSLIIKADVGEMLIWARQYDQAIAQCRKTMELDPGFTLGRFNLGLAYGYSGRHEAAVAELRQVIALAESGSGLYGTVSYAHPVAGLGDIYAASGRRAEARKIVDGLKIPAPQREVVPYEIAIIYAGLGEKDQALAWLEKAYEQHRFGLLFLKLDPPFRGLQADPRFAALLRRVGLTP